MSDKSKEVIAVLKGNDERSTKHKVYEKHNFLDGQVFGVSYLNNDGEECKAFVVIANNRKEIAHTQSELIKIIDSMAQKDEQVHWMREIARRVTTASIIALSTIATVCILAIMGKISSEVIVPALSFIFGFYFGKENNNFKS